MGLIVDSFRLHFSQQCGRHLRHIALWVVIVLTMIGARFFIPLPEDAYVTLSVNSAYPVASSGVIGLQLGIISALLLTPLAYIYLKAGPMRIRPWQIEDVTPSRRLALNMGQGLGDVAALFFILFWIGIAGLILCLFRLPLSEINPFHLFSTLFLVAGPAMIMVAGVKHLLASRPRLRGAWGDVLFFVFWMTGNVVAASLFQFESAPLIVDVFGFAASAAVSTSETITALAVGSAPTSERFITLDPVSGFTRPDFILARLFWCFAGLALLALAALIYGPRRPKLKKSGARTKALSGVNHIGQIGSGGLASLFGVFPAMASSLRQVLKPGWLVILLLALSIAGFALPFRKMTGPGIFLILIFMTSRFGASWEARHLRQLRSSLPSELWKQALSAGIGIGFLTLLLCLPSLMGHALRGELASILPDILAASIGLPIIALGLGMLTRSATFSRLLMLGIWYGYMNL